MNRLTALLAGLGLAASVAAPVLAQDLEDTIEARQAFMKVKGFYMSILGDMAKGKRPYDAELAKTMAHNLQLQAQMSNGPMWPAGSGTDKVGEKTAAKPEIWSTWPKIADASKNWKSAMDGLVKVAGNGLDALRGGMKEAGEGCKGCHQDFRVKKD